MEKKDIIELEDVENFMGIRQKDFVSVNAKKLLPGFDGYDKLKLAATAAFAVELGEPDVVLGRQRDTQEKFFKRLLHKKIRVSTPKEEVDEVVVRRKGRGVKRWLKFDDDQEEGRNTSSYRIAEMEKAIKESSGGDVEKKVVVIRKELTESDVDPHQNRMLLPVRQLVTKNFLLKEEEEMLNERSPGGGNKKKYMKVPIIMPSKAKGEILLRRWDMAKKNGSNPCVSYVLNGDWVKLLKKEGLRAKMEVELWAYRVNQNLHFALLNLTSNPNPNPNGGPRGRH